MCVGVNLVCRCQPRASSSTQYSLVCDRKLYFEYSQSIYMGGFLVGSMLAGLLADSFGRKWTATALLTGSWALGMALALMPNYWSFCVVRFFLACCELGSWMCQASLGSEITSSKFRTWVGGLMFMPYALGYSFTALVARLTRHWAWLQFWSSAPSFIGILLYVFFLPESPRWQLSKGKVAQAEKQLKSAAKWNNSKLPENLDLHAVAESLAKTDAGDVVQKETIFHVFYIDRGNRFFFKYPHMLIRALNLFFQWFVCSIVYFGVILNITDFAGNIFLNNFIAGVLEIPAYILCTGLLHWGRKRAMFVTMVLSGITLFPIPFIESGHWLQLVLVFAGMFAITASFSIIYVFTLELFPTVMRASGLSTCSCFARVGGILAPLLTGLAKVDESTKFLPSLIFGIVSLVAAALVLILPETKGKRMAEYLEDAQNLQDDLSVKRDGRGDKVLDGSSALPEYAKNGTMNTTNL